MFYGAQVIEKNRFLENQNRFTPTGMVKTTASGTAHGEQARRKVRFFLLLMAIALAAATLAPVAVLAA